MCSDTQAVHFAGVSNTEVWNNLGLCCFYASQFDMALGCLERAFAIAHGGADNEELADVWYNVGHIAIGKLFERSLDQVCFGTSFRVVATSATYPRIVSLSDKALYDYRHWGHQYGPPGFYHCRGNRK